MLSSRSPAAWRICIEIVLTILSTIVAALVNSFGWGLLFFNNSHHGFVYDGLTCALKFCGAPVTIALLNILFPTVTFLRRDLHVIGLVALVSPFLQLAVACTSNVETWLGMYTVFASSQFGILFTDNMFEQMITQPSKGVRGWLERMLRMFVKQGGGVFARTLFVALTSPMSFGEALVQHVGTRNAFVNNVAKLATVNELRLLYERSFRNVAMSYKLL
jgi:hypothetical protein